MTMSNVSEEGIATVKKAACEALLEQRTQTKLKGKRMTDVANRIHLAQPQKRDDVERCAGSLISPYFLHLFRS